MVLILPAYYFIDDDIFLKYTGKDNNTGLMIGTVAEAGTVIILIVVIVILAIK